MLPPLLTAQPAEVQAVRDAVDQDPDNLGVGILHLPTGQIILLPFDDLPNQRGHAELAGMHQLPLAECRGFLIGRQPPGYCVVNNSHLNGPQGQPGSLQMPAPLFQQIVQALHQAGL